LGKEAQIRKAQYRVKSGTANGATEQSGAETIVAAGMGTAQTSSGEIAAFRSAAELGAAGMAGSGWASGLVGVTQQQWQTPLGTQQAHSGLVLRVRPKAGVWAAATI